jgi:hypothetical protein
MDIDSSSLLRESLLIIINNDLANVGNIMKIILKILLLIHH